MSMKRGQVGRRGRVTKKVNPVFLYAAEGNNKTETIYLNNFKGIVRTSIKRADGNYTDPVKMMRQLKKQAQELELSVKNGDRAYCLIDTDTGQEKQSQIDAACQKQTDIVKVVLSSPCFEEWFLLHYRYSTGQHTSAEAVNELKRFCKGYTKSYNIYPEIQPFTDKAIQHAKRLKAYHEEQGRPKHSVECNPSSDIYQVVEHLLENLKEQDCADR